MISIFYDLETSDINTVGQIINFAFMAVDSDYNVIDTFNDRVRISRLQLPSVGAILANRTNVLEHQATTELSEKDAIYEINEFLYSIEEKAENSKVALVGYNSSSFDLDYLRTAFIRNGYNPYHSKLIPRDVFLVAKYLMATNDEFSKIVFEYCGEAKPNLKLETLYKAFDISKEKQAHESLFDVKLTLDLARYFLEKFKIDVRTFEPYKISHLHSEKKGSVFYLTQPLPQITSPEKKISTYPATLLDANKKYALWIDLEKYQVSKNKDEAIRYNKIADKVIFQADKEIEGKYLDIAKEALESFKDLNLQKYFSLKPDNCYLEQFIYRFPLSEIEILDRAIREEVSSDKLSVHGKTLLKRYWLENYQGDYSEEFQLSLKNYALYRYGGNMAIDNYDEADSEEKKKKKFHPTLEQMLNEINQCYEKAENIEDKTLIDALQCFYLESEIYKILKSKSM